jgi:hypothetical protein
MDVFCYASLVSATFRNPFHLVLQNFVSVGAAYNRATNKIFKHGSIPSLWLLEVPTGFFPHCNITFVSCILIAFNTRRPKHYFSYPKVQIAHLQHLVLLPKHCHLNQATFHDVVCFSFYGPLYIFEI